MTARRKRPYATTAFALWAVAALMIAPAIMPVLSGVPISEGFAPIGLSIGVLLGIGGTLLFFTGGARHDDTLDDPNRPVDD